MATTFEIAFPLGTPDAVEAGEAALDEIDRIEDLLTVYRPTSAISQLNAGGRGQLDEATFALLQHCAALTQKTGGAFDIAIGTLIQAWGFFQRQGRVPNDGELAEAMHASGMKHVILDAERRFVKYFRESLKLNLGSIGKGYALDRAADVLKRDWGIRSALLSGSSSSVLAIGVPPSNVRGWPVSIVHPAQPERSLGTVWLCDAGFATSAATYQSFEYKGRTYGHVLDPRTGRPAEGMASASVLASTAAEADALSTAMFIAGAAWASDWFRSVEGYGAVLLPETGPVVAHGMTALNFDPA